MTEKKQRINVSIPVELYSKITDSEYGLTEAVVKGLELILSPEIEIDQEILKLQETRIKELQDQIKVNDGNQKARLEELQDHNETLKKELEDYKQLHNNYMMQMQTVINKKAIEAPGKKKWFEFWK